MELPSHPTASQGLPKGSYVVPFWVCYVRDFNILPKKELHRRVWVGSRVLAAKVLVKGLRVNNRSYG